MQVKYLQLDAQGFLVTGVGFGPSLPENAIMVIEGVNLEDIPENYYFQDGMLHKAPLSPSPEETEDGYIIRGLIAGTSINVIDNADGSSIVSVTTTEEQTELEFALEDEGSYTVEVDLPEPSRMSSTVIEVSNAED
ncbi:hypothetical protein KNU84_gp019 [Bacteriophage DSS3_VP1]|uniref:Uncharacterized protein n=1 Tax=Bacteriophage DSS3_VP1 TaxID=2664196 RepID=A0A7S5FQA1_9CAUD|nr:hypothetical protein KNU84_gp019 [Bacteriophage DSS3_VP1]QGH74588.1 hypothetical protein DSS3VP1_00019 [Bacteriophage DSS3_VP1]